MVKHWCGDIRLSPPAIKKIFARKIVVMQQPGSIALVPLRERDLLNEACLATLSTASLTRRANHRHIVIVALISPRREIGSGLFCNCRRSAFVTLSKKLSQKDLRKRFCKKLLQKDLASSGKSPAY
jgi:hypothetical protein